MSWLDDDPELAQELYDAEEQYLKWCDDNGVEPYKCKQEGCDRYLPCRQHKKENGFGE